MRPFSSLDKNSLKSARLLRQEPPTIYKTMDSFALSPKLFYLCPNFYFGRFALLPYTFFCILLLAYRL